MNPFVISQPAEDAGVAKALHARSAVAGRHLHVHHPHLLPCVGVCVCVSTTVCVCINHVHAFIHAYMQASIHTYCTHSSSSRQQDLALFNDTLRGLDLIVIHHLISPVLNHFVQCPACPSECEFVRVCGKTGDVAHADSGCH